MADFIRGECDELCPTKEVKMRIREHLLDFYELENGKSKTPGKLVKSFSRSAAGVKMSNKSDLRTINALHRTVEYLLTDIVLDERKPYNVAYDFIFDRLRSVRQEIVIQNLDYSTTVSLLEPIVLFLAYSSYKLCAEPIGRFDPTICRQHSRECVSKILRCYDELERDNSSCNNQHRVFVESLYQISNLGSTDSLLRSTSLPVDIKRDPVFKITRQMSLEYYRYNYYRVLVLMKQLPHVLCAVASLEIQTIRRKVLQIFSRAYNSKQLTVPMEWLKKLLLYSNNADLINDCKYYNIAVTAKNNVVRFSKDDFTDQKISTTQRHELFVDEKFRGINIPDVLLLKNL